MANFYSSKFVGSKIRIDGDTYLGNTFENCVIIYGGGPLNFSNNSLSNCRWEFVDAAARTVGLLSSLYQSEGDGKDFVVFLLSTFGKNVEDPARAAQPQEVTDE